VATCLRLALASSLLVAALACAPLEPPGKTESGQPAGQADSASKRSAPRRLIGSTPVPKPLATGLKTEVVADGLQLPTNLVFAPDGRLFLTEVSLGRVRVIERGALQPEPLLQLDQSVSREGGLLGLALDPDFARGRHLYLFYSEARDGKAWRNRLVRFTEGNGKAAETQVLLDDLPTGKQREDGGHNGGRLGFGPDGKLYVTLGDVGMREWAQDRNKLAGKVLRINPDGSVPSDNPYPNSAVYAQGLRNPWGLTFHPLTGAAYVTDNGGKGHDEVNRVQAGGHYGAPRSEGFARDRRFVDPIWESNTDRGGITGLAVYTGDLFPELKNDLLVCTFASSRLIRLRLTGPNYDRVEREDLLSDQCHLDVASGPDGAIYFTSVSQVLRLVPGT
jgi:glucose/arabinose dehydrogenase